MKDGSASAPNGTSGNGVDVPAPPGLDNPPPLSEAAKEHLSAGSGDVAEVAANGSA